MTTACDAESQASLEPEAESVSAAAGSKRRHGDSSADPAAAHEDACAAEFRKWETSPQASIPPLDQMLLWAEEMERFGAFEIMEWMQELLEQVVRKVHRDGYTPEYGAVWGCGGQDEFFRDQCDLGANCHLELLPLDVLYIRNVLTQNIPPLRFEDVMNAPYVFSPSEAQTMRGHVENGRRETMTQRTIQRRNGEYTVNQTLLREATTRRAFHAVIRSRTRQIFESLSSKYLSARVSVLRIWNGMVIEAFGEPGLRTHWPEDRGDDKIMTTFLVMMSMRCITHAAIDQAMTHVIEGHYMMFSVPPPPFKVARWMLAKLKRVMAKERPEGRKIRPGLDVGAVDTICRVLYEGLGTPPFKSTPITRLLVNMGAALAFTFEKALRAGETCPGGYFDNHNHLSRQTIAAALNTSEHLKSYEAVIFQPPVRKTTFTSDVTRSKTSAPLVFDTQSEMHFSFCGKWSPVLDLIDPAPPHEWPFTPAFRTGGPASAALSTENMRAAIKKVAQDEIPGWTRYDYGNQSLRIGRINAWRGAQSARDFNIKAADEELNRATTHTSNAGRDPYDRQTVYDSLALDRAAESVTIVPVETLHRYSADRSQVQPGVYVKAGPSGPETCKFDVFRPCANKECDEPASDKMCWKYPGQLQQCCSQECHEIYKARSAIVYGDQADEAEPPPAESSMTTAEAFEAGQMELIAAANADSEEEEERPNRAKPAKAVLSPPPPHRSQS